MCCSNCLAEWLKWEEAEITEVERKWEELEDGMIDDADPEEWTQSCVEKELLKRIKRVREVEGEREKVVKWIEDYSKQESSEKFPYISCSAEEKDRLRERLEDMRDGLASREEWVGAPSSLIITNSTMQTLVSKAGYIKGAEEDKYRNVSSSIGIAVLPEVEDELIGQLQDWRLDEKQRVLNLQEEERLKRKAEQEENKSNKRRKEEEREMMEWAREAADDKENQPIGPSHSSSGRTLTKTPKARGLR
jgi:hypothetical protein